MSVTVDRAVEVFKEKVKAFSVSNDFRFENEFEDSPLGELFEYCNWRSDFQQETDIITVKSWGGEGEGESIGYVVSYDVDGEKIYLKVEGFYDSWNGTDWNEDMNKLVSPVERVVTFYE